MTLLPHSAEAELEHQKMLRLRKLRLQKEAAEKLAVAPMADTEPEILLRECPKKHNRNDLKTTPSRLDRGTAELTSKTLSEWLTQQARSGGRY